MIHARHDYSRIQDPAAIEGLAEAVGVLRQGLESPARDQITFSDYEGALSLLLAYLGDVAVGEGSRPIAIDEPVFLLRASDVTAPDTVRQWAQMQYTTRRDGETVAEIAARREMARLAMEHAERMERYQFTHGAKLADMPEQEPVSADATRAASEQERAGVAYIIATTHHHAELIARHLGILRTRWTHVRAHAQLRGISPSMRVIVVDYPDGPTPSMGEAIAYALGRGMALEHVSIDEV